MHVVILYALGVFAISFVALGLLRRIVAALLIVVAAAAGSLPKVIPVRSPTRRP